jgi:hypothetical protein
MGGMLEFTKIKVEPTFNSFAETFRNAGPLIKFLQEIPQGLENADYYFPNDEVIAELKTLESDAHDPVLFGQRIIRSVELCGYNFQDYMGWLERKENFPPEVTARLSAMIARPIRECIKKAIRQIDVTRRILGKPEAKGLVLLANSGNYGLSAPILMSVASREFAACAKTGLDGLVYFTPNVLNYIGDEGIGYELWVPVANNAGDQLQDFIDELGKAWFDYCDALRPSSVRQTGSDVTILFDAQTTADRPFR